MTFSNEARTSLRALISGFMSGYGDAQSERLAGHRAYRQLQEIRDRLTSLADLDLGHLDARCSVGAGNWARIPWIAFLDRRETTSVSRGVYLTYFFRADMSALYLAVVERRPAPDGVGARGREPAGDHIAAVGALLASLRTRFSSDAEAVDLRAESPLARRYEDSVLAYRAYEVDDLPGDDVFVADLRMLAAAYEAFVSQASPTRVLRCFLSGNNGELRDVVEGLLEAENVVVSRNETQIPFLLEDVVREIGRADFFVCLWRTSPYVGLELGAALGARKPCLVVLDEKSVGFDFTDRSIVVVPRSADATEALSFGIHNFVANLLRQAGRPTTRRTPRRIQKPNSPRRPSPALRSQLGRLSDLGASELERLVHDLLATSAAEVVLSSPRAERGADFALWLDEFEATGQNPILVEVKGTFRGEEAVLHQAAEMLRHTGARVLLLLYASGPVSPHVTQFDGARSVVVYPLDQLTTDLETGSLGTVLARLLAGDAQGSSPFGDR